MSAAAWTGALLWPRELPDAPIIDCAGVTALGVWVHEWLRRHPDRALVGLPVALRRQLATAAVPARCYDSLSEAQARGGRRDSGVSASEREMLWG